MLLAGAAAAATVGLTIAAPPQPTVGALTSCRVASAGTLAMKRTTCNTQNDNSQGNNNNQGEQGTYRVPTRLAY